MKERQILFSTPMVQAILERRKTMTRRILKVKGCKPFIPNPNEWTISQIEIWNNGYHPYGHLGDILWVRETVGKEWLRDSVGGTRTKWIYKANGLELQPGMHWKPSIHMPKAAARIWLKITDIRVERLNDITEEDARKEGVLLHKNGNKYFNYTPRYEEITQFVYDCWTAKDSFKTLWNSINKFPFNYRENPCVWVIEFEILSTTGKPSEL